MPKEGFKLKYAAILSAHIAGYSHPIEKDKVVIIRVLTEYREIIARTKRGQSDIP
jgi:hypothetical protein